MVGREGSRPSPVGGNGSLGDPAGQTAGSLFRLGKRCQSPKMPGPCSGEEDAIKGHLAFASLPLPMIPVGGFLT